MVRAQKKLLDHLGISKLVTVIGGSMGGMQAIDWCLQFPDVPESAIVIASCAEQSAQEIAFDAVGRNAITTDPDWAGGDYYGKSAELTGPGDRQDGGAHNIPERRRHGQKVRQETAVE